MRDWKLKGKSTTQKDQSKFLMQILIKSAEHLS